MQMRRLFLYFKIFELAKNMNKKSLIYGVLVTFTWLLGIYLFSRSNGYTLPTSLNELGDFLAGIFAPIAFFWLILGYIQQGKQLDQNTRALEQQEKALKLQIDEMRMGFEQQVELVQLQRQQLDEQHKMLEPKFIISQSKVNSPVYGNSLDREIDINDNIVFVVFKFTLENLGGDAFNLKIEHPKSKEILIRLANLKESSSEDLSIELTHFQIDELNQRKELEDLLDFSYECKNGRLVKYKLFMQLYQTQYPFFGLNLFLNKNDLLEVE